MKIDAKLKNEHEVMSMTVSERVSAFSALRGLEENMSCTPCLTTTPDHMAAVRYFLKNNNIDIANCDGEQALAILNVATRSHPTLFAMSLESPPSGRPCWYRRPKSLRSSELAPN